MKRQRIALLTCLFALTPTFAQARLAQADFAHIQALIQSRRITSLEQILAELPPEYLREYTLVHSSRSLQESSSSAPRVIVFNKQSNLILAFNGAPEQEGYDALEVMEFNDQHKRFELHEVTFPSDENRLPKATVSETNPAKCLSCHQANPRPIWEPYMAAPYTSWSTAFGSVDDYESPEIMAGFRQNAAQNPRYKYLAFEKDVFGFSSETSSCYPYTCPSSQMNAHPQDLRPNLDLTNHAADLNTRRILGVIRQSPYYPKYKAVLDSLLLNCGTSGWSSLKALDRDLQASGTSMPEGNFLLSVPSNVSSPELVVGLFALLGVDLYRDWDLSIIGNRPPSPRTIPIAMPAGGMRYFTGEPGLDFIVDYFKRNFRQELQREGIDCR